VLHQLWCLQDDFFKILARDSRDSLGQSHPEVFSKSMVWQVCFQDSDQTQLAMCMPQNCTHPSMTCDRLFANWVLLLTWTIFSNRHTRLAVSQKTSYYVVTNKTTTFFFFLQCLFFSCFRELNWLAEKPNNRSR